VPLATIFALKLTSVSTNFHLGQKRFTLCLIKFYWFW